jgi:hypothetical protein
MVGGAITDQKNGTVRFHDPANVTKKFFLDLRIQESNSALCRKDNVQISLEKCLCHRTIRPLQGRNYYRSVPGRSTSGYYIHRVRR